MADNFCTDISVPPLTEEKSQNLNYTKLVDQNAEKELEKK